MSENENNYWKSENSFVKLELICTLNVCDCSCQCCLSCYDYICLCPILLTAATFPSSYLISKVVDRPFKIFDFYSSAPEPTLFGHCARRKRDENVALPSALPSSHSSTNRDDSLSVRWFYHVIVHHHCFAQNQWSVPHHLASYAAGWS